MRRCAQQIPYLQTESTLETLALNHFYSGTINKTLNVLSTGYVKHKKPRQANILPSDSQRWKPQHCIICILGQRTRSWTTLKGPSRIRWHAPLIPYLEARRRDRGTDRCEGRGLRNVARHFHASEPGASRRRTAGCSLFVFMECFTSRQI